MKRIATTFLMFAVSFLIAACGGGGGGGTPDPNAGFKILTYAGNPGIPTAAHVEGQFLYANGTTTGTVESFIRDHSGVGYLFIPGAKVPARWRFRTGPNVIGGGSHCLTFEIHERDVNLNSEERLYCQPRFFGFIASPSSVDALNPPFLMNFSGNGIEGVYGAPALAFYDEFGSVVASMEGQIVSTGDGDSEGSGGSIMIRTPNVSQVYDGTYLVVIHNIRPDGGWEVVGAAPVTIFGHPPPPPPPPGGGGGCEPTDPDLPQLPCELPQN